MSESTNIGYEILRSLRRILRKVSEHSRSLAQTTGLTVRAVRRLTAEHAEVTVAMVAARVHLANATISRILDRLERAKFIRRERLQSDRRKVGVSLTTLGEERLKDLPLPLHEQFVRRVEALDEEDRAQLLASLDRVVAMMEAEDIDAAPVLTPEVDVRPVPDEIV